MNNLASCGSVWNWSFAQHPQFGNCCVVSARQQHCILLVHWCQKAIIGQRSWIFTWTDRNIAFTFWIGFFLVTGLIVSTRDEPCRRELWQGESLHSPCCLLEKTGFFDSKKLDPVPNLLLLQKGCLPAVTGPLLWQLNFSSEKKKILSLPSELCPGNAAWLFPGRSLQS